ncbi:hypothetical protein TRFO_13468 [Tritrichomonas foetus]|uniref:Uncharacterized protein n=1 Tax=Tritrichomonas foetus TaxID=1144522 RepID=A0A1J4KY96_9EUKA|nr:hypothetical protein TRFO_13468 [Tritrichomonas foetus]|eukprot:OHT16138.1 hypothetical protein TRFO_13468 [Tritrichomonas foetus]
MSYQTDEIQKVQIHLTVHQENDDIHIDFDFDTKNDDLDGVVNELIKTLGLSQAEAKEIKGMVVEQIEKTKQKAFQKPETAPPIDTIPYDSDDEEIDDPEYLALLDQQKRQIAEMDARHLKEQQMLIQKLSTNIDDLLIF